MVDDGTLPYLWRLRPGLLRGEIALTRLDGAWPAGERESRHCRRNVGVNPDEFEGSRNLEGTKRAKLLVWGPAIGSEEWLDTLVALCHGCRYIFGSEDLQSGDAIHRTEPAFQVAKGWLGQEYLPDLRQALWVNSWELRSICLFRFRILPTGD